MKIPVLLLIALALVLKDCNEPESSPGDLILKVKEKYDAGNLELIMAGISDSRCPKGVECVWAGAAIATLVVQASSGQDTLALCLGDCRQVNRTFREENTDTLFTDGRQYAVTLLEVSPYPGTGKAGQPKEARFRLELLP